MRFLMAKAAGGVGGGRGMVQEQAASVLGQVLQTANNWWMCQQLVCTQPEWKGGNGRWSTRGTHAWGVGGTATSRSQDKPPGTANPIVQHGHQQPTEPLSPHPATHATGSRPPPPSPPHNTHLCRTPSPAHPSPHPHNKCHRITPPLPHPNPHPAPQHPHLCRTPCPSGLCPPHQC